MKASVRVRYPGGWEPTCAPLPSPGCARAPCDTTKAISSKSSFCMVIPQEIFIHEPMLLAIMQVHMASIG